MILFALLQRLFALVSLAVLGLSGWLVWSWWDREQEAEALGFADPSNDRLYWGLGLLAFSFLGRFLILLLLGRGGGMASDKRREGVMVDGADGSRLRLEIEGRADGPILLLTHGWGMSSRIWADASASLSDRFGVAAWDLPGAGLSTRPTRGWSIEGFADDLKAVIDRLPEDRPVVVVGHSIGGMTTQTFCARHPEMLNGRVAGVVLENTTHHNPLRTMILSGLVTALRPLIELMMRLDIILSPLVWLMNWQSYLSGSTHLAMRIAGFGAWPTRAQLDLSSRLPTLTSPAVQAHGNLAMIRWSVTDRLPDVSVPTLVLVGGRDVVTKDHAGEFIAQAIPHANLVRIPEAGHMGPVERNEVYVEAVARFAAQVTQVTTPSFTAADAPPAGRRI